MTLPRVLLISGEYPPMPGGIGDYTANLRLALAGEGVRSVVLASRGAQGEDVHTVRGWRTGALRQVESLVKAAGIDVVHIQYQAGAYEMQLAVNALPYAIRRRTGLPVVTTFHDLRPPFLFPKAGPIRDLVMLRMARASSAVVVTNPGDERTLATRRIATETIHIGPNLPPPTPLMTEPDRESVAYFGFPTRSKGILELIEALGGEAGRSRPKLVLVGAQGTPGEGNDIVPGTEIEALVAEAGVVLERTGYLPAQEASNRLARAGVIALPFRAGASLRSGSLLAALQTGRPVVTTEPSNAWRLGALAGMRQLALVIRDDPDDLRDAMMDALGTQVTADPLPMEFRWQGIGARHRALYEALTGSGAGTRGRRRR